MDGARVLSLSLTMSTATSDATTPAATKPTRESLLNTSVKELKLLCDKAGTPRT